MTTNGCTCATGDCAHWSDCAVHNGPAMPAGSCDCGGLSGEETELRFWKRYILKHPGFSFWLIIAAAFLVSVLLTGCAGKPVIQTQVLEKPVPVYCKVQMPTECKDAYAVDRVSPNDPPLTINRALRIEIEERWSCEIKLRALIKGCSSTLTVRQ